MGIKKDEVVYTTATGDKNKRLRRVTDAEKPDAVKIARTKPKKREISRRGDGVKKEVTVLVPRIDRMPIHPVIIDILKRQGADPRNVEIVSYNEVITRNHPINRK